MRQTKIEESFLILTSGFLSRLENESGNDTGRNIAAHEKRNTQNINSEKLVVI